MKQVKSCKHSTYFRQYHRGKTPVPPWEYWSFPAVVLAEGNRNSTGTANRQGHEEERNQSNARGNAGKHPLPCIGRRKERRHHPRGNGWHPCLAPGGNRQNRQGDGQAQRHRHQSTARENHGGEAHKARPGAGTHRERRHGILRNAQDG